MTTTRTHRPSTSVSCMTFFGEPNLRVLSTREPVVNEYFTRGRTCINCDGSAPVNFLPIFAKEEILVLCKACLDFLSGDRGVTPVSPADKVVAISTLSNILDEA